MLHVQNGEIDVYSNVWRCSRDHLHVTGYTYDGKRVNLNVSIMPEQTLVEWSLKLFQVTITLTHLPLKYLLAK